HRALHAVEERRVHEALCRQRGLLAALDVVEVIDGATAGDALEDVLALLEVGHLRRAAAGAALPLRELAGVAPCLFDRAVAASRDEAVGDDRVLRAVRRAADLRILRCL